MNEKDHGDVADAWLYFHKTINERKRRAEQHHLTARADDDDDDDPYGDQPMKCAEPKNSMFEVSALEAEATFMTMRSGKRKYQPPPPPVGGPQPLPGLNYGLSELFVDEILLAAPQAPDLAPVPPTDHLPPPVLPAQLPGPSGVHGAYLKGRRRSYEAYAQCGSDAESEDDEQNASWYFGPYSDDPHSDAHGD